MYRSGDGKTAGVQLNETRPSWSRGARSSDRGCGPSKCPSLGARFGPDQRYELREPIGVGGSAVVHQVKDHRFGTTLAGKFAFTTPDGFGEAALAREGAMLSRLQHESIISLMDRGREDDVPYLLLEYAPGDTLATLIACSRPAPLQATRALIEVVAGLMHAHQRGIFHLDIKPSNIIQLPSGRIKIIDFGAGSMPLKSLQRPEVDPASQTCPHALDGLEQASFMKGTLHYMAPEQWSVDPSHWAMDLWAAGMLYYELLTGVLPFGSQPSCLRLRNLQLDRVPFSSAAHGLPPAVEHIFAHTLALDPYDRFASAARLLEALAGVEATLAREES